MTQVRKIAIIGPECTGKSDLSRHLASVFDTVWVPEFARDYLDSLGRAYTRKDLLEIAKGQLRLEDSMEEKASDVLICDTNLYVIKVWSEFKYGEVDSRILQWIESQHYDLYLLTYIDVPWEADPLREHPNERATLFEIYRREMQNQNVPFLEIRGDREQRRKTATKAVRDLLAGHKAEG